ncbi:UNVERIFIED_CONTAM: PDZ domain-containing protein [Williamsia faeni]
MNGCATCGLLRGRPTRSTSTLGLVKLQSLRIAPGSRRIVTFFVALAFLIVFVLVGTLVKVPYVALGPGPTVNTLGTVDGREVVNITGAELDPTTGNLNLTTVSVTDGLTLFQAIGMWVSGDDQLEPRDQIYPPGKSNDEVDKENRQQMSGSEDSAKIAALNHLGRPIDLVVAGVAENGPSAGKLEPQDKIVAVNGKPVATSEALREVIAGIAPGTPVAVDVIRDGNPVTETVTLVPNPKDETKGLLGITLSEQNGDPNLEINFDVGDIGGPSAGLMLTLAIIDKLSPGELNGGEFIAGTGTIDSSGDVGEIGGIQHKMRAARDAGATAFLVPAGNCVEAKSDTPDGLTLVKVDTLDDAINGMADIDAGRTAPSC